MSRKPRIVVPGAPHNVCLRGNNRRRLFSSFGDRTLFLRCLERGIRESECLVHQITLMNNHVHLIARPPTDVALSCLVSRSCQRYAQQRNADRAASGKLFEERFYSRVIEDDAALMLVTLYNDANAYQAGIAATPFGHEWSTGPLHAGLSGSRIPTRLWTPSRWYLALGANVDARAATYRHLIGEHVARTAIAEAARASEPANDGTTPYKLRLERPDRSAAREALTFFRGGLEKRS